MSKERNLLNIPPGLMSKEELEKMTFNNSDQKFMSRVLGFHYDSMSDEIAEKIGEIIDSKYDQQTKTLAQVVMEHHADHMREVKKLTELISDVDAKVEKIAKRVGCHTRDISKIKKAIEEIHQIKL